MRKPDPQEAPMHLPAILILILLSAAPDSARAQSDRVIATEAGPVRVETVARGLEHPWALAFLPDGRFLVTERPGRLRVVAANGEIAPPVAGVPTVFARGQGGLLDVALAPDFATSRVVYLSYAEPGPNNRAGTTVARGRLNADASALEDTGVIFRQEPKVEGANHFGSRLVFARDGTLFIALGERYKFEPAQDLGNHLGTIVRINPDGSAPADNPFVNRQGAWPEIWSYGHRNIQAATLHPLTGALWVAEMGPRGGDELNRPMAGGNHGWPLVSWGTHYDLTPIPAPSTRPDLAGSVHHWTPSIAPSGMTVYTGDLFPAWRGSLLIGALRGAAILRVTLNGEAFASEERIGIGARVRDVRQGPDGAVHLLTDESRGRLLRLIPAKGQP
jgi:glucose/arabinose dehydrogenase